MLTMKQITTAISIQSQGMTGGTLIIAATMSPAATPSRIPASPPICPITTDSSRNWFLMVCEVAPKVFRRPISLVRSFTETSMNADQLSYVDDKMDKLGIEIHSGANRVVRRMFEALGYNVKRLDRVYFAGLTKGKLRRGAWRPLTEKEISMLKSGNYQ